MDNLSTLPQLEIPLIPDTECAKGNQAALFNYYFQNYLARATVNIPGLGSVTPEEIQDIQENIQSLQNQIDALEVGVRSGTVTISTGDSSTPVTFSTALPNSSYSINIEFISAAGSATAAAGWAIVTGTKTASGFTVRTLDVTADITSIFYTARQIPS